MPLHAKGEGVGRPRISQDAAPDARQMNVSPSHLEACQVDSTLGRRSRFGAIVDDMQRETNGTMSACDTCRFIPILCRLHLPLCSRWSHGNDRGCCHVVILDTLFPRVAT